MEHTTDMYTEATYFHFDNSFFEQPRPFESLLLYQIGDLSCKGDYVVPEHEQLCYEISYIVSGKGVFVMDGKRHPVEEGDIILNVPGQVHYCQADHTDPFRFYYVGFHFSSDADDHGLLGHIQQTFDLNAHFVTTDTLGIEHPFLGIFHELMNLHQYATDMIETYLRQLVVLAYRSFYEGRNVRYRPQKTDRTDIVYHVVHYIDANLYQMTELSEIAKALHYSYSYLSRAFRKEIGLTIKEYYNQRRFETALDLLASEQYSVTQVAEKLQYQSIHAFSKAFRNYFGVAPSEYERAIKME